MIYPLGHHSYDRVTKVGCHRSYVSASPREKTKARLHKNKLYHLPMVMVAKRPARVRKRYTRWYVCTAKSVKFAVVTDKAVSNTCCHPLGGATRHRIVADGGQAPRGKSAQQLVIIYK